MRYWLVVFAATLAACGGSSSAPPSQPVVEDTTPPIITATGDNPQLIEAGEGYTELGATATDNLDGDLSASIVINASTVDTTVPGDYTVTYDVSDSSANAATTVTRTVTVQDTMPPVITLLGDDPQGIVTGDPYVELGATAADSLDGDLTAAIVIDASAVDTTKAGDYAVIYDVSDAAGNAAATVTRTVRIQNPPLPAAPTVSIEGNIKQLIFSWDAITGADYYRLLENADGHSGFTQVGDAIPAGTLTTTRDIAVHLFDWVEAQYLVEACNLGGCNSSSVIIATDIMLDTIGYFKAGSPEANDHFGGTVTLSADGNTLAVGAWAEDSGATGINGDQADNSARDSGAVYVFRFSGTDWNQEVYIKASNTDIDDRFGGSVALSDDGNTLAVGAGGEDSDATGVNGNQTDNSAQSSGAVYVFRFEGGSWYQQAYVKASNTDPGDVFGGVALSADGNTLAVGARFEDSASTGINGDQFDDRHTCGTAGAVYLFRFDDTEWFQQAYIKASNTGASNQYSGGVDYKGCIDGDLFGTSVSLSADGNRLVVGAPSEDSSAIGIDGDQSDSPFGIEYDNGAVYAFAFDGANWSQQAYIKPSFSHSPYYFGHDVALSADGKTLAVGAPLDGSIVTGANDPPLDVEWDSEAIGAVHIFRHNGSGWMQESYIKSSNPEENDLFGITLALSADGNTLAVGAPDEDSSARGIGGDQLDDSAPMAGAAYVYRFGRSGWMQHSYVKAPNSDSEDEFEGDHFGGAIAVSEDGAVLAVGAQGEDSSATGINGDREDNTVENAGAVYLY